MTFAAAAAASINSVSSYALSPHAAPFNPPSRPACAPLECRQNGDISRSAGASSVGYAEEKTSRDTHSASPIACALMKSSGAVYPPSTHAMHTGQLSSWSAVCLDAYPSSPYVRITSNYKQQNSLTSGNGSKSSTVRIERPPNKTSETNKNSCGSGSKLVIAENPKSNKDSEKETSSRSLQFNGPVDGKDNSQGTMFSSKEANPVFSASPLHIPTTSADSCGVLAEDVMPDPSECSVDSPCYRGAPIRSSPPTLSDDEGYRQFRQAPEQDPHALHPLRPPQLPPPEEHLLLVRLPRRPHPQVQLECESHQAQDHWHWKDEVHAPCASQVQEQLQRRYRGCPQE